MSHNRNQFTPSKYEKFNTGNNYCFSLRSKIVGSSILQLLISAIFWTWAVANMVRGTTLDAGVITFVFPFIAGIFGLLSVNLRTAYLYKTDKNYVCYAKYHLIFTVFGHLLVTLNYGAGASLSKGLSYRVYCIVFTLLWFFSTFIFGYWAKQWSAVIEEAVENTLIDDHDRDDEKVLM